MRKYNRDTVILLTTLATFVLVSIPSIKLFFSTPIINLIPLLLFGLVYLSIYNSSLSPKYNIKGYYVIVVLLFFTFCVGVYFVLGSYSEISLASFFDYFYYFCILYFIVLLSPNVDPKLFLKLVIIWALFLAFYNLTIGFSLDRTKGQNYLTYGLPVGAGLTAGLVSIIGSKNWRERKPFLLISAFLFVGLLVSRGRASLIFPILTSTIYLLTTIFYGRGDKWKKILIFVCFGLFFYAGVLLLLQFSVELTLLNRLEATSSDDREEPRMAIWVKTVELISENFLGYGVNSYQKLIGSYPHNIFLESLLSFGIFGFLIILVLACMFLYSLIKSVSKQDMLTVKLGFLGLYFFLCWNISYDLTTSYIPISLMILTIVQKSRPLL